MARPSKKQKDVKYKFDLMTSFLNDMEQEFIVDKGVREPDVNKLAILHGKVMVLFTSIADDMEIYRWT